MERMNIYTDKTQYEIQLFDTRILFLITALNAPSRNFVKNQLNGNVILTRRLKEISKHCNMNISLEFEV